MRLSPVFLRGELNNEPKDALHVSSIKTAIY